MNSKYFLFITIFFLPTKVTVAAEIESFTIENGLQVVLWNRPSAPLSHLRMWIKSGSAHEEKGASNAAHALEHIMFGQYDPKEKAYFTQAKRFAKVNANTRLMATVYSASTSHPELGRLIELEAKRFSLFNDPSKESVKQAKAIITQEHLQNYAKLDYQIWQALFRFGFQGHPFEHHTSGYPEDLEKLTTLSIKNFIQNNYAPDNACLVVVGSFDSKKLSTQIEEAFKKWRRPKRAPKRIPFRTRTSMLSRSLGKGGDQSFVAIGFPLERESALSSLGSFILASSSNSVLIQVLDRPPYSGISGSDFNNDYDFGVIKVILRSPHLHKLSFWRKIAQNLAEVMSNISREDFETYLEEYHIFRRETQYEAGAAADMLARQCGKYSFPTTDQAPAYASFRAWAKGIVSSKNAIVIASHVKP